MVPSSQISLPGFLFAGWCHVTRQAKFSTAEEPLDSKDTDTLDEDGSIVFLGRTMTQAEYQESCRNMAEFFRLLKSWRKGEQDESSEL